MLIKSIKGVLCKSLAGFVELKILTAGK